MRNLLFIGVYAKGHDGPKSMLYLPIHFIKWLEPTNDDNEYKVFFTLEVDFHNSEWQYYTSLPMKYRDEIIFPMQNE